MTNCRRHNVNAVCKPTKEVSREPVVCETFTACLGLGNTINFDGDCVRFNTAQQPVADGEYGVVVVKDNCIVELKPAPTFVYTPPPCTPAATPCGSEGSGPALAPGTCNLLSYDASGRLSATLTVRSSDTVTATGCGTTASPLVLTANIPEQTPTYIQTDGNVVDAGTGTLADPYFLSLSDTIRPGTYAGFSVSAQGRITGYEEPSDGAIYSLTAGPGIEITGTAPALRINLPLVLANAESYSLGGYTARIDTTGRVTAITRTITTESKVYNMGTAVVLLDEYGSIAAIQENARAEDTRFGKLFPGEREATEMSFTTTSTGYFQIEYHGDLGASTPAPTTGLIPLPPPYRVLVDGRNVPAYARVSDGRITDVYTVSGGAYPPGDYIVTLTGPAPTDTDPYIFKDYGMMSIALTGDVS